MRHSYLIPITNQAFIIRQLRWARHLELAGQKTVIVSCVGEHLEKVLQEKSMSNPGTVIIPREDLYWIKSSVKNKAKLVKSLQGSKPKKIFKRMLEPFRPIWDIVRFPKELQVYRRRIDFIRQIIREHKIDVILLPESSPAYDTPLYAKAAKEEGIVLVTAPFSRDNPESYAAIYKTDKALTGNNPLQCLTKVLFSHWVISYQGKKILRLEPWTIFIHELLGIASPSPWHTIGKLEDFVCVQNKIDFDFYSKHEVSHLNLRIIGSPEQDGLAKAVQNKKSLKREICKELELDPERLIILTTIVQTHWVSGRTEAEFQNYEEMIKAWMLPLQTQNRFNVIISLHPSQKISDFKHLESEYIKICPRDVTEAIAVSDVLVACLSSVIPAAISAGLPVINYDVYRYSEENAFFRFNEAPGTITVLNAADYNRVVNQVVSDDGFRNKLCLEQDNIAQTWGVLDGQSIDRLNSFLDGICSKKISS